MKLVGFKYRSPSIKIGGVRVRKNKKGYSISRKTILGGEEKHIIRQLEKQLQHIKLV